MWKIAAVCLALVTFSAPVFAQNAEPEAPGVSPGMVVLGAAGLGLAVWGIAAAAKKSSKTTCASGC